MSTFLDMKIVFALVARSKTVLAGYNEPGIPDYFKDITIEVLGKVLETMDDDSDNVKYIAIDIGIPDYAFHCNVQSGMVYICLCSEWKQMDSKSISKARFPFLFLKEFKDRFTTTYGDAIMTAGAFKMNSDFGEILKELMEEYNARASHEEAQINRLHQMNPVLDETIRIARLNLDNLFERGEKLEKLVEKAKKLKIPFRLYRKVMMKVLPMNLSSQLLLPAKMARLLLNYRKKMWSFSLILEQIVVDN